MINFNHPQLAPDLNRVRRAAGSVANPVRTPNPDIVQPLADPDQPYRNGHIGLFDGSVADENGKIIPYTLCVPSTMRTSGRSMLIFLDSSAKSRDFIKANAWEAALEKYETSAFFIEAPDGWHMDEPGWVLDVTAKMLAEMRCMERFPANAPTVYCFGFGDGAAAAAMVSMFNIGVFAAIAVYGDCDIDQSVIDYVGNLTSDGDPFVKKGEVELPAFILSDNEKVVDYFKKCCSCKDEILYNAYARVWRQEPKPGELYINEQAVCEVWQTKKADADAMDFDKVIDAMLGFITMFGRWGGEGNWYIRRTQTPASQGFIRTDKMIDGLMRRWYMFEPTAYKRRTQEKYPLVIAIHGFSCSGPFFAENSAWHAVAESRGFLVCYPTAYPFKRRAAGGAFGGNIAPTPAWNSAIDAQADGPDEVSFFRQMIDELKKIYPIDEERIYVSGHSNGSAMTQKLMRYAPELFAGFNPVGGMEMGRNGVPVPEPDDGYKRPVWYMLGEYDRTGMYLNEGESNAAVVKNVCNANGIDYSGKKFYINGIYHHHIVCDADHAPLVRFTGCAMTPHTYSPEMALMVWDEFFTRLRRKPDGSIEFIG